MKKAYQICIDVLIEVVNQKEPLTDDQVKMAIRDMGIDPGVYCLIKRISYLEGRVIQFPKTIAGRVDK
jgi:hypothetical protein